MTPTTDPHVRRSGAGVGIDVGGTKMLGALVDPAGSVIARARRPTPRGQDAVIAGLCEIADELVALGRSAGLVVGPVAIGMPGTIDRGAGRLTDCPILDMSDVPVVDLVGGRLGHAVTLLHDVKTAAFGELVAGAGIGQGDAAYINLGTGVSMAFVFGWKIHHGHTGTAGEIGHVVVEPDGELCNCGRRGCLEMVASGPAIARLAGSPGRPLEDVAAEAQAGDARAVAAFGAAARAIGGVLADYMMVLDLGVLMVGGGVSAVGSLLIDPLQAELDRLLLDVVESVRVVPAALGAESGVIGAAHWSRLAHEGPGVGPW